MSIDKYFEREYNFLQISGEEFAKKHPTLGSRLHLSERERKDPFVERLYEGFAFLAGRIHERLDDSFPEIAGGILEILFPNMLKPFPSCSILQAKHKPGAITKPVLINKGSEIQTQTGKYKVKYKVHSGPSEKEEPAEFIFRTTQNLLVRPIRLEEVIVKDSTQGNSSLILRLQPDRNVDYNSLDMSSIQIYLHGSASIKYNLHLFLTNYITSISIREISGVKTEHQQIENFSIGIPELSLNIESPEDDHSILPYSKQTFSGFRLLQEYFSFPEKFFFVDIKGLESFDGSGDANAFEIKIDFDRKLAKEKQPSLKNILLHCTPIVNLFSRSTEEVIVDHRLPEYHIVPDLDRRKSREIYSVDKVSGISETKLEQYKYIPITSHDILETNDPEYNFKRFFSVLRRIQTADMTDVYIRLFGKSMDQDDFPSETLSIEATLSNGFLPSAYLGVGAIKEPLDFPAGIEASNITVPSEVLEGPERENYLWSLIAHLSTSYTSIANVETIKSILKLYNWAKTHNHPNTNRIEGIKTVHRPRIISKIINQSLIRGIEFHIEVDPKDFEQAEGDINLLGMVLNKFLSQYVTINSYILLKITEIGTGKEYKWEPILGEILPV
ncbi:MAG: type VI secretion system baseplate subunit TssF [Bacteroidetes bacterium]|nr:type VI secretion system baseplate subunit TssF [Bacteroidota bacterium]